MDELDGTDVHTSCGLGDHVHIRLEGKFPGDDHLLHIAAGEAAHLGIQTGGADVKALIDLTCVAVDLPALSVDAEFGEFPALVLAHQQIVGNGGIFVHTGGQPVLRHMGKAQQPDLTGAQSHDILTVDVDLSGIFPHTGDGLQKLTLAVALNGGDAEDLPGPDLKIQPLHRGQSPIVRCPQVLDLDLHLAGFAGLFHRVLEHLPAHHHRGQDPLADVLRLLQADELALAHDTHPVRDGHDLVELVGDDDHRHALLLHDLAQHCEKLVCLLGCQHRRGLVQDQDIRAPVQRLEDLHPLLQTHADLPDHVRGVHMQAVFLRQLPHRVLRRLLIIEKAGLPGFFAQHNVLGHGEAGHQHEVLVDHAHTPGDGIFGRESSHFFALNGYFTGGGRQNAVENVHQRGLAGAILTHQGKNLAPVDGHGDVVIGPDTGEIHGHMGKFHNGFHHINSNRKGLPAHIQTSPGSDPAPYPTRPRPGTGVPHRESPPAGTDH